MSFFDVLNLIPKDLQQAILDALVDFVSGQAEKVLGSQVSDVVKPGTLDPDFGVGRVSHRAPGLSV
jgi:hypothetical protein